MMGVVMVKIMLMLKKLKMKLTIVCLLGEHIHPPLPPHSHPALLPALAGHQVNLIMMIITTITTNIISTNLTIISNIMYI